ncbi:MAG TPA: sigma-54 dependent transcriptional regulator [Burkholderiales bacterium]|nr:sigma-54 dependent transcriptional regulator [Burkholderiales bacterium]
MGESLSDRFGLEGFEVDWCSTGAAALRSISLNRYAAVISDLRLPDIPGEDVFRQVIRDQPLVPPFVFITAFATVERAVELLKLGAADFVTKPFDIGALVEKVRAITGARAEVSPVAHETVLGVSAAARKVCEKLDRIATRAPSILITGESGVGKEVLARHIHSVACVVEGRENRPFIAVNCGALPETLVESEFFGFERGAFTGADRMKRGFFEQADGGTLFLDEIGDLPATMQVKLLRALQERRIKRLGGESEVETKFRVICATNKDLPSEVQRGRFREDLFYRINLVHLNIPPLRERPEDILWLAARFVAESCDQQKEPRKLIHPLAQAELLRRRWPGNVRELKNVIERACIISSTPILSVELIEDKAAQADPHRQTALDGFLASCERAFISSALQEHHGRIADTAKALGISRKSLWEKMRRHNLSSPHS